MVYEIKAADRASALFGNWDETLIWSCLQGIMGKIYADDPDAPAAAMAVIGDFTFFAGKPNRELVSYPGSPDQNLFPAERKAILSDSFCRNASGTQYGFIPFFFNLVQRLFHRIGKNVFKDWF